MGKVNMALMLEEAEQDEEFLLMENATSVC